MSRYIDADGLIRDISETYCKWCKESGRDYLGAKCKSCQLDDAIIEVERVATESIDIVFCKECRRGKPYSDKQLECDALGLGGLKFPNDFCSYGERKDQ